ncbi:hypothetical protein T265_11744 [Opisthorchis viverrini]|uniref:Uncharacterized protein n=1 Tax=Opisthorchis viverrini TaxID=6198 RepID=A0A074Z8E3_OPIVI|nr:hypothetical protein T265_11744 [Opisthorchis viverrini]KER19500.1 hypothetical protein T265_11744 [Opisthorchis viverrini]
MTGERNGVPTLDHWHSNGSPIQIHVNDLSEDVQEGTTADSLTGSMCQVQNNSVFLRVPEVKNTGHSYSSWIKEDVEDGLFWSDPRCTRSSPIQIFSPMTSQRQSTEWNPSSSVSLHGRLHSHARQTSGSVDTSKHLDQNLRLVGSSGRRSPLVFINPMFYLEPNCTK